MKKRNIPRILAFHLALLFLIAAGVSCTADEQASMCGDKVDSTPDGWLIPIMDVSLVRYYDRNVVHYEFLGTEVSDACIYEHVKVTIDFVVKEANSHLFSYNADVTYGIFHEYPITSWDVERLEDDWIRMSANADVGLKASFIENPGWYFSYLSISFMSRGSGAADDEHFKSNFAGVAMNSTYYKPK